MVEKWNTIVAYFADRFVKPDYTIPIKIKIVKSNTEVQSFKNYLPGIEIFVAASGVRRAPAAGG